MLEQAAVVRYHQGMFSQVFTKIITLGALAYLKKMYID